MLLSMRVGKVYEDSDSVLAFKMIGAMHKYPHIRMIGSNIFCTLTVEWKV